MRRIVVIAIVSAVLLSTFATAAQAAPKTLSLYFAESGQPLVEGAALEAPTPTISFSIGKYTCSGTTLNRTQATLQSNAQKTDGMAMTSAEGGRCEDSAQRAALYFEPSGFPWTLTLGANGKVKATGAIDVGVPVDTFGGDYECAYEGTKLSGTLSLNGPATITLSGKLKHRAGATEPCNKTLEVLSWQLGLSGAEGPVDDLVS